MANSKKSGFTLIEALVAITILLLGVLGPLSTATRGITDGLIAKDKIVALGLAQEGIELVRAKISDQWLNNGEGSLESCVFPTTCWVEILNNVYSACAGTGCELRSDSNGFYVSANIPGVTGQIFTRTIKIEKSPAETNLMNDNTEAKVTVTVGWYNKSQQQLESLITYVYNNPSPNSALP